MDKKTLLAFLLIFGMLTILQVINKPSQEEIEQRKQELAAKENPLTAPVIDQPASNTLLSDKGMLAAFNQTEDIPAKSTVIENDDLKLTFSSKGGRLEKVEVKDYKTYKGDPLLLMGDPRDVFTYQFFLDDQRFSTQDFDFELIENTGNDLTYRLTAGEGQYIEQKYRLSDADFSLDYDLNIVGLQDRITSPDILLNWDNHLLLQEKDLEYNRNKATFYYYDFADELDYLSERGDDEKDLEKKQVRWLSMHQQFFNQTLIAKDRELYVGKVETKEPTSETDSTLKVLTADLYLPYGQMANYNYPMEFYFGPNHYNTLKAKEIGLEKSVYLGYSFIRWVNLGIIIPLFNFLNKYIGSYGIIILLLTLIVKSVLFPLTFRSYKSMAKMSVLKPEMEELKEKYKDNPQKQQQATMQLYQKTGVNPLGGCLPQLLQFPILVAMYYFFPNSIELRQESFLWASDLSTYDSIFSWDTYIPLISNFYGNHISLFTLLSAGASLAYTQLNSSMQASSNPQMKYIQYIMPIFLVFIFNSFAAALTYYFFLSSIITFGQQWTIKKFFIDEDKLREQLKKNKTKPRKQGKFAKKMQAMLEEQQKKQEQLKNQRAGKGGAGEESSAKRGTNRQKKKKRK